MRHRLTLVFLIATGLLAGCGDHSDYPRLLPLSQLNKGPDIPAHAADAAANPEAVGAALRARRAEAKADADAAERPVADAAALNRRADALRDRAAGVAATPIPKSGVPAETTAQPAAEPAPTTAEDARVKALRDRARALQQQPVATAPSEPLAPCPPGTTDPVAASCDPS